MDAARDSAKESIEETCHELRFLRRILGNTPLTSFFAARVSAIELDFVRNSLQFSVKMKKPTRKHIDSIDATVLDRIRSGARDRVWMPTDFLDLGSRAAVDKTLSRGCQTGLLRRAGRGLYHLPRKDAVLGELGPSHNAWNDLLHRKAGGDILPSGAHAANALGLSDQVPMRSWYFTTGRSCRLRNGRSTTVLRHVSPRFVSTRNPISAQVILALRWIGKRNVDDDVVAKLRRALSPADRSALPADADCAPTWIAEVFRRVAAEPEVSAK